MDGQCLEHRQPTPAIRQEGEKAGGNGFVGLAVAEGSRQGVFLSGASRDSAVVGAMEEGLISRYTEKSICPETGE